jgi:hypothetical protein
MRENEGIVIGKNNPLLKRPSQNEIANEYEPNLRSLKQARKERP